jgi:S1-C subfamily serine protease
MLALFPTLLLLAAGFGHPDGGPPAGDYGQWAREDPGDWPSITMVNRIRYSDSSHPVAGCAFLLEFDGEIVAATAKHVLRYFKSEAMDTVSFRGTLVSWEMFTKDAPTDVTVVGALINEDPEERLEDFGTARDWVLLTVERTSEGVTPLRLRTTPLETGEPVFVVGWRYPDEGRQHIYRGKYVRSEEGSLLIDVAELADNTMPGLSGAPVIDARGYVVGMMSSKSGKRERLASIDYPRLVLEQEPRPATDPRAVASPAAGSSECAQRMTEHFGQRGWVGITPEVDEAGAINVADVFTDSPAERAGVRRGDILRGINGIPHGGDPAAFRSAYDSLRPGIDVVFDLERDGGRLAVEVRVEPIPEAVLEQWIRQECP